MTEKNELTGKQRAFIDAWFACRFNGTEAARRAGYQGDYWTLAAIASENLKKPKIAEEIANRWKIHGMTAEEVMSSYARIARADIGNLYTETGTLDWSKVKENGDLVESLEWLKGDHLKVKLYSRQSALDSIARCLGMFKDKIDIESGGKPIGISIVEVVKDYGPVDES